MLVYFMRQHTFSHDYIVDATILRQSESVFFRSIFDNGDTEDTEDGKDDDNDDAGVNGCNDGKDNDHKDNYEYNNEDGDVKIITLMIMKKDNDGKDDDNDGIDDIEHDD